MKNKIIGAVVLSVTLGTIVYMIAGMGYEGHADRENSQGGAQPAREMQIGKSIGDIDNHQEKLDTYSRHKISDNAPSKLYIVKCAPCHGRDGKGIIGLSIAGKSYEYNYEALLKYKNGSVKNTLMKGLLENTPDEELKSLAAEISAFE